MNIETLSTYSQPSTFNCSRNVKSTQFVDILTSRNQQMLMSNGLSSSDILMLQKKDLFLSLTTPLLLWDFAFQNRFSFVADIRAIKALKSQKLQGLGGGKAGDESSEFSV